MKRILISAAFILGFAASPAFAATPAAETAPASGPQIQNFGDWDVRCFPIKSPSPCDMFEATARKDNGQRVMSTSIAYIPSQDRYVMQIAVPLGVSLSDGLVIAAETYTSAKLPYRRCDRDGCYVEMAVDNDAINALKRSTNPEAKLNLVADGGRAFALKLSLNGFVEAHDTMKTLAKQKATAPQPASATAGTAPAAPTP